MAQLLVRNVDNTHPDPEKDKKSYKKGDVVGVFENNHVFSLIERSFKFRVVNVPHKSVEDLQYLLEEGDHVKRIYRVSSSGDFIDKRV